MGEPRSYEPEPILREWAEAILHATAERVINHSAWAERMKDLRCDLGLDR